MSSVSHQSKPKALRQACGSSRYMLWRQAGEFPHSTQHRSSKSKPLLSPLIKCHLHHRSQQRAPLRASASLTILRPLSLYLSSHAERRKIAKRRLDLLISFFGTWAARTTTHLFILCLVSLADRSSLRPSISLAACTPSLQAEKKTRRLALLVTLRPLHPCHPRQERSTPWIVTTLNRSLQSTTLVRVTTLLVQSPARVLARLPLPRWCLCHIRCSSSAALQFVCQT